jgi:predicted kinase
MAVIQVPRPWLIAVKGYPGSGKSTVASALSRELRWPILDKDDIQDTLDRHLPSGDGPGYEIMFQVARGQLLHGISVILDSSFWKRTYDTARALADEVGARLVVIECCCADEAEWRRRIEARQAASLPARRTTTWDALDAYRSRYDAEGYTVEVPHLSVDTASEKSGVLTRIRTWLDRINTAEGSEQAGAW